jgi:hypothetical protein
MDITDKIEQLIVEIRFKKVVRKGKLVKKAICPPGFKVVSGKCVKMSPAEARKRAKATKKAQRKIQAGGKAAKLVRSRAKSMRKRQALIPTAQTDGGNAPS